MARIAFFTLNVAREPFDHPQMRGFVERIEDILAQASASPGFIEYATAMSVERDDPRLVWPAAKPPDHEAAMTLTLWRDVDAVFAFAYQGWHADALRLRREWTIAPEWPSYVAWWVADDEAPTWRDAAERHEWLRAHGPTPRAFDFRTPFDAEGRPLPPVRKPLGLALPQRMPSEQTKVAQSSMTMGGSLPWRARGKDAQTLR